jgi:lipopolysaccharide/colanic/teichoic acid biosynthesis glycosyltransferase
VCSILVLASFLPLMAVVALLIKVSSAGPMLFRQTRTGRDGVPFELLKFRTMYHKTDARLGLTRYGDPRITPLGRFLRACKLDELPQFVNVVLGEMSVVGPRPDLPKYWQMLRANEQLVLSLPPGITGVASLNFRHEEMLLASVAPEQLENFYVDTLLPQKVQLELQYAHSASLCSDLKLILRTVLAMIG